MTLAEKILKKDAIDSNVDDYIHYLVSVGWYIKNKDGDFEITTLGKENSNQNDYLHGIQPYYKDAGIAGYRKRPVGEFMEDEHTREAFKILGIEANIYLERGDNIGYDEITNRYWRMYNIIDRDD